jgi:hypothetical protein
MLISKGYRTMRFSNVQSVLLLSLLLAVSAWSDEPADRSAIDSTISSLNGIPRPTEHFTADSDAPSALDQLWKVNGYTVAIAHEPWGEANIKMKIPTILGRTTRFITSNVALVDGTCSYAEGSTPIPLLFVMKKEGDVWKIASLRVLETPRGK